MYIPEPFREARLDILHALMSQYSFGTLVTQADGEISATHLPFLLDADRGPYGVLRAHMARANRQWESLESQGEMLVIFQGPHSYVSPSWYQTTPSVPTWNYVAIHAYGTASLVTDPAALATMLDDMVRTYETHLEYPRKYTGPREFLDTMMQNIVGFEIAITRLCGKLKLSQNRSKADQEGVITALKAQGDTLSSDVAKLMAQLGAAQ